MEGISHIQTKILINNEWVNSMSGETFATYNPSNKKKIADVQKAGKEDIDKAVKAAREAFKSWGKTYGTERSKLLWKLADLMEQHTEELARLESIDNGKPYKSHSLETDVPMSIKCYRYYAGWADKIQGKTIPLDGNYLSYTRHEPIGVAGQLIPWNFPLLMQAWKWAPALAAGCTVVLKPSQQTPLSALRVGELAIEAGFPPGVVNIVPTFGEIGQYLASHPDVDKVAFTGSTGVGKVVGKSAAESNLKDVSLELGGKGPHIVLPDADIAKAAKTANFGLFFNMGQCCSAGSRVYVHDSIHDEFVAKSVEFAKKMKVGDPFEDGVEIGPQINQKQLDKTLKYIELGKQEGAKIACGGNLAKGNGYFIEPTIFTSVTDDMKIAKDEIFGPVLVILKFSEVDEVIQRANDSIYGLSAGVFTTDVQKAITISNQLQAGTVWINCFNQLNTAQPFGGYKQSGYGRELGEYGLMNYLEVKSVMIDLNEATSSLSVQS